MCSVGVAQRHDLRSLVPRNAQFGHLTLQKGHPLFVAPAVFAHNLVERGAVLFLVEAGQVRQWNTATVTNVWLLLLLFEQVHQVAASERNLRGGDRCELLLLLLRRRT